MQKYKIKLMEIELNKLNLIEHEKIRNSCMSILSYLLKKNFEENSKLKEANCENLKDPFKLKISMRTFLEKYNPGHKDKKMSIRTFKKRIDLLIKLGLIAVEKIKNSFVYSFYRFKVNEKVNEKVNTSNTPKIVENTYLQEVKKKHKYINFKIKPYIYNNSVSHVPTAKTFVSSLEEVEELLARYILKFNIKYDFAIKEIKRRLNKKIKEGTLRIKGVENYLISILNSIKNQFIPNCLKTKKQATIPAGTNKNIGIKEDRFNNYAQRNYNYNLLENALLGNVDIDLNKCVESIEIPKYTNNSFDNYEQRDQSLVINELAALGFI